MKTDNLILKVKRAIAFYIDWFIIVFFSSLILLLIVCILKMFFLKGYDLLYLFCLSQKLQALSAVVLFLFKDALFKKRSLGKRIMELEILDYKNCVPSDYRLISRNLFILIWPIEALILLFFDKRLGDMIFHTKVIYKKYNWKNNNISKSTYN